MGDYIGREILTEMETPDSVVKQHILDEPILGTVKTKLLKPFFLTHPVGPLSRRTS